MSSSTSSRRAGRALAAIAAACTLSLQADLVGDVVIGDWENSDDGWIEWSSQEPLAPPTFTYGPTGATRGTSAVKVIPDATYDQHLAIKLQNLGLVDDFLANTRFSIDVTWDLSEWNGPGTWAKVEALVVNAEGTGWSDQGVADIDTGNPNYRGGWDPTNFGSLHTRTMTWDYSHLLDGDPGNGEINTEPGHPYWVELVLITTYDSAFTSAAYHFDNARLWTVVTNSQWTGDADNNWSSAGNWNGAVPGGVDHVANFGSVASGRYQVNVDVPRTLGVINFDSPVSYTLSGPGTLSMQASAGDPRINVLSGSHTIAAPLRLNNWLFVDVANGASLNVTGEVLATATGRAIRKNGQGLLSVARLETDDIAINAGTLAISAKPTANSPSGTTVTDVLTVAAGARLDLNNNSLIVNSGSLATVTASIKSALENGGNFDWLGPGIGSTQANVQNSTAGSFLYGLGVVLNDLAQVGGSGPIYTTFAGQTLTGNEILVKFTYFGDADLSGSIDATDYSLIDNGYVNSLSGWINGDFDYSGTIDATDYALIDNAYVNQAGPLAEALIAEHTKLFGGEYVAALRAVQSGVVPEPATMGMLLMPTMIVAAAGSRLRHRRAPA
ncbi:hypothetical protein [Fontivita pretiosa]|uniref:hypothetical protein n=1 Tax=Fontivita pretiosa TaxID=2989684 RepID=UPI003D176329